MAEKHQTSPTLPWLERLRMAVFCSVCDFCRRQDGTFNRFLLNIFDPKSPPSKTPRNGVISSDVTIDPSKNLWFRIYVPTTTTASLPVVIFFHGGGFVIWSPDSVAYDDFCRHLAGKLPAIVVSVNYRLSPEHKYRSHYEDGIEALKYLDNNELVGFPLIADRRRCFLAGDSAGANLAHHVAVGAAECEFRELKVIGIVAIQPFFGGEERVESEIRLAGAPFITLERADWMWKAFLPDGLDRDHPAVNVTGPNSDEKWVVNYPDTVLFVGGFDPLLDWQKRYYEVLKRNGKEVKLIEYPNAIHGFYFMSELPELSFLVAELKEFVKKQSY